MALLSQALNIAIDAYMTYILVKSSVPSFKFHNALKTSMVGQFFSAVTPFATGGQPMQVYCMSKYGVEPGKGVSALTQKFCCLPIHSGGLQRRRPAFKTGFL